MPEPTIPDELVRAVIGEWDENCNGVDWLVGTPEEYAAHAIAVLRPLLTPPADTAPEPSADDLFERFMDESQGWFFQEHDTFPSEVHIRDGIAGIKTLVWEELRAEIARLRSAPSVVPQTISDEQRERIVSAVIELAWLWADKDWLTNPASFAARLAGAVRAAAVSVEETR